MGFVPAASSHLSTPVPAASALGREPAGIFGNTGSLGEALQCCLLKPLKPRVLFCIYCTMKHEPSMNHDP